MQSKIERHHDWGRSFRLALAVLAVPGLLAIATTAADAGHGKARRHDRACRVHHQSKHRPHNDRSCHSPGYEVRIAARYPAWCADPSRVVVWKEHPFFLHAGFGVYFGGPAIAADLCNVPPAGCAYFDPFCHRTFGSIAAYHRHLRHRHHAPLVQVMIDFD